MASFFKFGSIALGTANLSTKTKLLSFKKHVGPAPNTCDIVWEKSSAEMR